jgi:hypothetical protein
VVVHYFHVFNACVSPTETNTPLIVDANAVLPFAITRKRFKAIARGHTQIVQLAGDLELPEFSLRNRRDIQNRRTRSPLDRDSVSVHANDLIMQNSNAMRDYRKA